jgi:hypothetical protein
VGVGSLLPLTFARVTSSAGVPQHRPSGREPTRNPSDEPHHEAHRAVHKQYEDAEVSVNHAATNVRGEAQ